MAYFPGTAGNDTLVGTAESDSFQIDAGGIDVAYGGDGVDYFSINGPAGAVSGSATFYGEGGGDSFSTSNDQPGYQIVFFGGAGNDRFALQAATETIVDAGEGDDEVRVSKGSPVLTLGVGADTVVLYNAAAIRPTITDFQASTDRLDFSAYLRNLQPNWSETANPFVTGHVRLVQSGADTLIQILAGSNFTTFATLQNVASTSLTAASLMGFDPGGGPITGQTLTGSAGADNLFGSVGDDTLLGGGGSDTLTGGFGSDRLEGGAGDDALSDDRGGSATLIGGDGADDLMVSRYINQETGGQIVASGGEGADFLHASSFSGLYNNGDIRLYGDAGNDRLDARAIGDAKGMWLYGGVGDDSYFVDGNLHLIFENADEGIDTVFVEIGSGLYLYDNIENLTLLAGGTGSTFGVGNLLANVITGNELNNLLLGGAGNDTIKGGVGTDSLFGEDGADWLYGGVGGDYLVGGAGTDTMLGEDGADALYGQDGADFLSGGAGLDTLVGGAGDDSLNATSGLGEQDLLDGGAGNDTYGVDAADDLTFEAVGGGTDTVTALMNGGGYYLYANVENLNLAGVTTYGVGNELDNILLGGTIGNWLLGGAGNDTLNGLGGNDVLFGQAGADTFVFVRGTGGDVIGDFAVGVDKIQLTGIYSSFDQARNSFHQNAGDTAIDLGFGDFIVVNGVAAAAFTAGDFIF